MKKYIDFKNDLDEKLNEELKKYCFYAFDQEQFDKGLTEIKTRIDMSKYNETNKFNVLPTWSGAYVVADKMQDYKNAFIEYDKKLKTELENYDFLVDAIIYEMGNHEYMYTMDDETVLLSLGYNFKDREENTNLKNAWFDAKKQYFEYNADNM